MDADMLQVAKNEIYASYQYQFKSPKWTEAFENRFDRNSEKGKINVDDSLTAIDKYNIAFINKKLAELNNKNKALAAK